MDYQAQKQTLQDHMTQMGVANPNVLRAIMGVEREAFVPLEMLQNAYVDLALPIAEGQTISQPSLVAYMTEQLQLKSTDRVLEVGTGSGYQTAILAKLAKEVFTIEIRPTLSDQAERILTTLDFQNVQFFVGNGMLGIPADAPFDAIIVTAAASEIPQALIEQLKVGGRMIIPVDAEEHQQLTLVVKSEDGIRMKELMPVRFVPIVEKVPDKH